MRVAVYVRVSTKPKKDETQRSQDTAMQTREILAYLAAKGLSDYELYEDRGYSGTKDSRPSLKRLMADCKSGKIQMVICWKLDRLFRSLRHLVNTLEEFQSRGIQFVALKDSIDLTTHTGRFMMQILGAVAEFEAAVIRERVLSGLANAQAKGKKLGRRPLALEIEHVKALLDSGATQTEIAKSLKVSPKTVQRAIKTHRSNESL